MILNTFLPSVFYMIIATPATTAPAKSHQDAGSCELATLAVAQAAVPWHAWEGPPWADAAVIREASTLRALRALESRACALTAADSEADARVIGGPEVAVGSHFTNLSIIKVSVARGYLAVNLEEYLRSHCHILAISEVCRCRQGGCESAQATIERG